jgi:hypothetical protein
MSYILNSISAWRTAQAENPSVADDIFFLKALKGPKTALVAQYVMYNWIVPSFATNVDAAKEFLLLDSKSSVGDLQLQAVRLPGVS